MRHDASAAPRSISIRFKRWIVVPTFGWFNCSRRLSKNYELLPETSETVIQVTMIRLTIRRLARITPY
jgi:putative transposase